VNGTAKHLQRESSGSRGWLSSFFGDESSAGPKQAARRRLLVAFALAIAIHEIVAGVFPWRQQTLPPAPKETITLARLTRIEHRPTPTPKPKPKPTPQPIVHAKTIAETHVKPHVVNPGNPSQQQRIKRIAKAAPVIRTRYHSKPAQHVVMGAQGAGTSKNAKAFSGGVGTGGTGTGESGTGSGTGGAPAAHEPCGYVDFQPTDQPIIDKSTGRVWEKIEMVVHFPDGSEQTTDLDYTWYYPSKAADPFMPENQNVPATFQFPPANQRDNEPPLVQYVIQHTDGQGFTKLRDCPK
jgi:hypothetical protein